MEIIMKGFRYIQVFVCLLAISLGVDAQTVRSQHNVFVNVGGGLHSVQQSLNQGSSETGFGGLVEGGYQYMFNRYLGISGGLQISLGNSATKVEYEYDANLVHPDNNREYTLHTGFNNWKEHQTFLNVSVPIEAVGRLNLNDHWTLQGALGGMVSLPVYSHYNTVEGEYTTTGWFPSTNVTYTELHNHGFSTTEADNEGKIELNAVAVSVIADLGVLYNMTSDMGLYFGLYASYAVTNSIDASDRMLYDGTSYGGVFQSNCVKAVHPFSAGVKLGIRLGVAGKFVSSFQDSVIE